METCHEMERPIKKERKLKVTCQRMERLLQSWGWPVVAGHDGKKDRPPLLNVPPTTSHVIPDPIGDPIE